ncbi:MAG: Gfo/Idh/MocA family oxidoreductase [Actinomycetes bacterium]
MSAPPPTPAPSRPPASPIGIGVIGCGSISRAHAVALRLVGDDGLVRVVAVSDPDPEAVERFVRIAGGDPRRPATAADLIADPEVDAVVVIAPTRFHREIIGAVAAAGKACFTEKPLAPTFDVVQDIAAVVAGAGIPTQVGFQTRFQPLYRQLHADVSEGTHGRVMAYLLRDDQFWPTGAVVPGHSDWRSQRSEAGGGALLEHSIHSCDVLTWCFGPVRRVTAATRAVFGYDVEDVATLMIEHESGVIGTLVTVFNGVRHREERRLETFFERATVEITSDFVIGAPEDSFLVHRADAETAERLDVDRLRRTWFARDGFDPDRAVHVYQYFAHHAFARALLDGRAPSPGVPDAVAAHTLVEAAYRSAATRQPVDLTTLDPTPGPDGSR